MKRGEAMFSESEGESYEQIEKIARNILKFRVKHNLYILPSHDVKKWAELVIKEGGCPRVPSRKGSCPCKYALDDIKESHCCRRHLFVDEEYLKLYEELEDEVE